MTNEEELEIRAELLAGDNIGKKVKMKKVLVLVQTALGGTFVEQMVEAEEESDESNQLL